MDNDVMDVVRSKLQAAGGEIEYSDLISGMDYRLLQRLPRVLTRMKSDGEIVKGIDANRRNADGKLFHFIRTAPAQPPGPAG